MKKLIILILSFLSLQTISIAQDSRLRFIAAYPNFELEPNLNREDWDVVYTSAVLKIKADSLIEETVLNDSLHMLYFLRHYHYKNNFTSMLVEKKEKYGSTPGGSFKILIIDTKSMDTALFSLPSKVYKRDENYNLFKFELAGLDFNQELKYAVEYSNFDPSNIQKKSNTLYYIFNPSTREIHHSSPAHYQYAIPNGNSIGPYLSNNADGLYFQSDTIKNLLLIPSALDVDSVYHTPLPPGIKISKHGAFLIINDPQVRVMYFYERTHNPTTITLHIYNKQKAIWKKLILNTVDNGKILMKNFNGWLAGANKVQTTKGSWNEKNKQPGQEVWSRERTKYSPSIYEILEAHERHWFSEGSLYLYNIETEAFIEWKTGQADSEILLVEDNKVYYRKYDAIYEVPIIKGKQLGKHRLLIKHKYVPSIHFMFKTAQK